MKTFRHGGKIGDCIYALPTIRELGGGILYLPERTPDGCNNLYSSLKDLLLLQPYIHEVREYPSGLAYMQLAPGIHIDYDLDRARLQPQKGLIHIVKRYMDAFGINYPNWKEPWLRVEGHPFISGNYCVINYTGRHVYNDYLKIKSNVDWKEIYNKINGTPCTPIFLGTETEHKQFCEIAGPINYVKTANLLEVAILIKHARKVYCNQSSILSLSQALGKTYYLEPKPMKRNCLLETPNENILQ